MAAITFSYLVLSLLSFFSRGNDAEKEYDLKDAPTVTIQIPTKNELIALRCAEKCLEFDYPHEKFEIVIGDDSDEAVVSQKLDAFAAQHPKVKIIKRQDKEGFKPGNLNSMLKHSKGEILVLFDSDFVPEKDFLRRIVAPFVHDKDVSVVQARWNFNNFHQNYVSVLASTIVYVFHYAMLSFLHRFNTASLCGSAEAIRKKDLVELGSWKSGSLTEDIEYTLRLYKENKKLVYLPNLECYSEVPFKAKDLYKQQMRWAYGVVASYIVHARGIVTSKSLSLKKKILAFGPGFGYLLPLLMLALFAFGTISLLTNEPAPLDVMKFVREFGFNTLLTSGLLFASAIVLWRAKKAGSAMKMILSSFTFGLVTTYYVNKGIFKSLLGQPMEWYLLAKNSETYK